MDGFIPRSAPTCCSTVHRSLLQYLGRVLTRDALACVCCRGEDYLVRLSTWGFALPVTCKTDAKPFHFIHASWQNRGAKPFHSCFSFISFHIHARDRSVRRSFPPPHSVPFTELLRPLRSLGVAAFSSWVPRRSASSVIGSSRSGYSQPAEVLHPRSLGGVFFHLRLLRALPILLAAFSTLRHHTTTSCPSSGSHQVQRSILSSAPRVAPGTGDSSENSIFVLGFAPSIQTAPTDAT